MIRKLILFPCILSTCLTISRELQATDFSHTELANLTSTLTKYGNNPKGIPALSYAVLQNDEEAIDLLLKHGASLETTDYKRNNCLHYAIEANSLNLFQKFALLGLSLHAQDEDTDDIREHPLSWAIHKGANEITNWILKQNVIIKNYKWLDFGDCAIFSANFEAFEQLIKHDKIQPLSKYIITLTHSLTPPKGRNIVMSYEESLEKRKNSILLLLSLGANINYRDEIGRTALKAAQDPSMRQFLIEHGAY